MDFNDQRERRFVRVRQHRFVWRPCHFPRTPKFLLSQRQVQRPTGAIIFSVRQHRLVGGPAASVLRSIEAAMRFGPAGPTGVAEKQRARQRIIPKSRRIGPAKPFGAQFAHTKRQGPFFCRVRGCLPQRRNPRSDTGQLLHWRVECL